MKKLVYESALCNSAKNKKLYNPNKPNATTGGVAFIVAIIIMEIISIALSVLLEKYLNFVKKDDYLTMLIGLVIAQLVIGGIALTVGKIGRFKLANGGGFSIKIKPLYCAMGILLITGLMFCFMPMTERFVSDWQYVWSRFIDLPIAEDPEGKLIYGLATLILTPILPAIFEEWLYRGIIMKGLQEFGNIFALIVSSLMFALMHGSMEQFIYQFIIGFAIGGVVLLTKNYLVGCVMHYFNNLLAQLTVLMEVILTPTYLKVYSIMSVVIGVVCIMIALCYFGKMIVHNTKNEGKYTKGEHKYLLTTNKNYEYDYSIESWDKPLSLNERNSEECTLFMDRNKCLRAVNKKSKKPLAMFLVVFGLVISLALVILSDFGYISKLVKIIIGIL